MSFSGAEEGTPRGAERVAGKTPATSSAAELDASALLDTHFVSLVRGYEELYMCEHPQYADRQRRRRVWEQIGTIVAQPAEDCRKRWKRIRENYFRSMKRAKRDSSETVHQAKRPAHEKMMSFLNPTFQLLHTKKQLNDNIAKTVIVSNTEDTQSESNDSGDGGNSMSEDKQSSDASDSPSSDDDGDGGPARTGQAVEAAPAPGLQQSQLEHDDIVDFFVELGESVKDFPEGVRIHVKREAFKIVTDAEEMLYNEKVKANLEGNFPEQHE